MCLRYLMIFHNTNDIYTKLTLKYFRRVINRGRAARSEVPAVVCIHSGEA